MFSKGLNLGPNLDFDGQTSLGGGTQTVVYILYAPSCSAVARDTQLADL